MLGRQSVVDRRKGNALVQKRLNRRSLQTLVSRQPTAAVNVNQQWSWTTTGSYPEVEHIAGVRTIGDVRHGWRRLLEGGCENSFAACDDQPHNDDGVDRSDHDSVQFWLPTETLRL